MLRRKMARPKRKHRTVTCKLEEIEARLDAMPPEFDLIAFAAVQVGVGFGAYVNAVLLFRRRDDEET
jgi:hypothetical protein